jgi:hypothetical protein
MVRSDFMAHNHNIINGMTVHTTYAVSLTVLSYVSEFDHNLQNDFSTQTFNCDKTSRLISFLIYNIQNFRNVIQNTYV